MALFWDSCGLDYISMTKLTGVICGAGLIVISFQIAKHVFGTRQQWLAWLATYLLAVNMSLGYWAPAGLETVAFALAVASSLLFYLKRSYLLIWTLALAVWLRPEGAFVAALLVLIEGLLNHRLTWSLHSLRCAIVALIISLPMAFFKIIYYGSLLPNSFYAKNSDDLFERISYGSIYLFRFLSHYGFWGAGLVIAWLFWRKLNRPSQTLLLFVTFYNLYIVFVGGDVLKVSRFFIPLLALLAVINVQAIMLLTKSFKSNLRNISLVLLGLVMIATTIWMPWDFVNYYKTNEAGLLSKMRFTARSLKKTDSTNFSVALTTIGAFSYELIGHRVIDMLGLTDSTIARHPQPALAGIESTWLEGKYNCEYLLSSKPDYLLFSTGAKPSAPAEIALFLYPKFLTNYKLIGWDRQSEIGNKVNTHPVFKKRGEPIPPFSPAYSISWVKSYKRACELLSRNNYPQALKLYLSALKETGPEGYPLLHYFIGNCYRQLKDFETSKQYFQMALTGDSNIILAHRELLEYALAGSNFNEAVLHVDWIKKLSPWSWPSVDSALFNRVGGYDNFLKDYVDKTDPANDAEE